MAKKYDMISFRCQTEDKEAVELAARISGCSVSDFIRLAALEKAASQISSHCLPKQLEHKNGVSFNQAVA